MTVLLPTVGFLFLLALPPPIRAWPAPLLQQTMRYTLLPLISLRSLPPLHSPIPSTSVASKLFHIYARVKVKRARVCDTLHPGFCVFVFRWRKSFVRVCQHLSCLVVGLPFSLLGATWKARGTYAQYLLFCFRCAVAVSPLNAIPRES